MAASGSPQVSGSFPAGEVLLHGSLPFRLADEGKAWLRQFPVRIAVRPQFPLAGATSDMISEVGQDGEAIEVEKSSLAVKDQIAGPVTYLEVQQAKHGSFVEILARLEKSLAVRLSRLVSFPLPRALVLDEPAMQLVGAEIGEEESYLLIENFIELIRRTGTLAGIHCCQSPLSDGARRILGKVSADLVSVTFQSEHADLLSDLYRRGKLCCLGLSQKSLMQGPEAFERILPSLAQGAGMELADLLSQTLFSAECGLGLLQRDESEQLLRRLFQFRDYFFEARGFSRTR